jgi:hypothetical protein
MTPPTSFSAACVGLDGEKISAWMTMLVSRPG